MRVIRGRALLTLFIIIIITLAQLTLAPFAGYVHALNNKEILMFFVASFCGRRAPFTYLQREECGRVLSIQQIYNIRGL